MPLIRKPSAGAADTVPAGAVPAAEADPALTLDRLLSGSTDERWSAARAAETLPGGVKALEQALAVEKDLRVREALLTTLARMATPQSVEVVLPLLRSDDPQLRTSALDALVAMKGAIRPYLGELLQDADADVRILACELARNMPDEAVVKLLCETIDAEPEANVCAAAVEVLAETGNADALPALDRARDRFRDVPFLVFAINTAADRLRGPSSDRRA